MDYSGLPCCVLCCSEQPAQAASRTRLDDLARTATTAAVRQDTAEAPQREVDRQKTEAADAAAAQEKAKAENKAQFRP